MSVNVMPDYVKELKIKRKEARVKRRIKTKIRFAEILLKNMTNLRYDLVYKMLALEKVIQEIAINKGYEVFKDQEREFEAQKETGAIDKDAKMKTNALDALGEVEVSQTKENEVTVEVKNKNLNALHLKNFVERDAKHTEIYTLTKALLDSDYFKIENLKEGGIKFTVKARVAKD